MKMNKLINKLKENYTGLITRPNKCYFKNNFFNFQSKHFYNLNKANFARNASVNLGLKKKINSIKIEENVEKNDVAADRNIDSDIITLEIENMKEIIKTFYKRGKEYQLEGADKIVKFEDNESYLQIYNFIVENLKQIKEETSLEELVRAISYFGVKDEKTSEIMTKFLSCNLSQVKKVRHACIIIYTSIKIKHVDENLFKKCVQVIKEGNFDGVEKQVVLPFIWALSEKEISNKELNIKIDNFVKSTINEMSEYDLSMIFRFYSKLFYFNYDVLEVLIKKCLEFCPNLSLRYILIITKCLAEMNIRNLNLLTGLQDRLAEIIKLNEKYTTGKQLDSFNIITADSLAQLMSNFVKIEFIDFDDFDKYEILFFQLAEKNGINNRDTVFSIISTHSKFIKKIFSEMGTKKEDSNKKISDGEIDDIKKYENSLQKKKQNNIRTKKAYKQNNENFFENISPYLQRFSLDINFQTAFNIFVIIKNSNISKRKILRSLIELYLGFLDKFLNPESIKAIETHKVDIFIKCGFEVFDYDSQKNLIVAKLKELNIKSDKFIKLSGDPKGADESTNTTQDKLNK